jgi:ABC-type lipoprotein release transport system permease subunit
LRFQAEIAVGEGADLVVSEDLCGGNGPIALASLERLASLTGISHGEARVVGRAYFVDRLVAVVGLNEKGLLALKPLVRGEVPKSRGDVVVGEGIVKAFGVKPGPGMRFALPANNRKIFVPTGTLIPACLWGSEILIMHLDDANEFFRMKDRASHHLLYKAPGSASAPLEALEGVKERGLLRVTGRQEAEEKLRAGYGHRGGIFIVLFVIAAALAVPALVVISGFGLREMDKEIGVLKATGWGTKDVLEKVFLQNIVICVSAVSLAVLLSMVWVKGLNGALIAQFYIAEIGLFPGLEVPSRYLPSHALFCLAFSLVLTLTGCLVSTWKKTRVPPSELMR